MYYRLNVSSIALSLAFAGPAVAAKREALVLEPSSTWTVNYADDSCELLRDFGTDDKAVRLRFERFQPSETFRLSLIGAGLKTSGSLMTTIKLGFGKDKARLREVVALTGRSGPQALPILVTGAWSLQARPNEPAGAVTAGAETIAVDFLMIDQAGHDRDFKLMLGHMDKPMAAFRACTEELLTHWGIDLTAHKSLSRDVAPLSNPTGWVQSKDYPPGAARANKNAIVNFRLTVDAAGRPIDCAIQGGIADIAFREATCRALMNRARFSPALDATGQPLNSYFTSVVSWFAY